MNSHATKHLIVRIGPYTDVLPVYPLVKLVWTCHWSSNSNLLLNSQFKGKYIWDLTDVKKRKEKIMTMEQCSNNYVTLMTITHWSSQTMSNSLEKELG